MSNPKLVDVPFELQNISGDLIRGNVHYLDDGRIKPTIIICHSFMAFKDWGFFPHVGNMLAEAGFVASAFNFSHNGVVGDREKITDVVKFSNNTFSKELEDLRAVVDAVPENRVGREISNSQKIALLGHSRGGGDAIIHTASDPRIRALVSWSAISTFDRWTNHQKEKWKLLGYLPLAKDTTASPLRLGIGLLNDLEHHHERLNILNVASRVSIPWLIIHGKEDVTVKCREAEMLYRASNTSTTELRLMDHVGHLYHAASPEEDHYITLNQVLQLTTDWFHRHLS